MMYPSQLGRGRGFGLAETGPIFCGRALLLTFSRNECTSISVARRGHCMRLLSPIVLSEAASRRGSALLAFGTPDAEEISALPCYRAHFLRFRFPSQAKTGGLMP